MRYYMVTTSDGTILTRSTASRTYTHCVAGCRVIRAATPEEIEEGKSRIWFKPEASKEWLGSWAGRLDLAQRMARGTPAAAHPRVTAHVEILEAVEVDKRTYDAARKRERVLA